MDIDQHMDLRDAIKFSLTWNQQCQNLEHILCETV